MQGRGGGEDGSGGFRAIGIGSAPLCLRSDEAVVIGMTADPVPDDAMFLQGSSWRFFSIRSLSFLSYYRAPHATHGGSERSREIRSGSKFPVFANAYRAGTASRSGSRTPPPKLRRAGSGPPCVSFTAQYLNS